MRLQQLLSQDIIESPETSDIGGRGGAKVFLSNGEDDAVVLLLRGPAERGSGGEGSGEDGRVGEELKERKEERGQFRFKSRNRRYRCSAQS
jgi:hypothetical protein